MIWTGAFVFAWKCIYLMLPAFFANMAPVFFRRVPFLDFPVDFGVRWRGRELFGSHKTFRGFFFGILLAVVIVGIQEWLASFAYFRGIGLVAYSEHSFVLLGFLLGFGALFGDLVKSFVKRRAGIASGRSWFPWDQLDFVVGALVFLSFVHMPSWRVFLFLLVAGPLLHVAVKHVGYYLGISRTKW